MLKMRFFICIEIQTLTFPEIFMCIYPLLQFQTHPCGNGFRISVIPVPSVLSGIMVLDWESIRISAAAVASDLCALSEELWPMTF